VIGYASGTPTHDQDFALIKPALRSILQRNPDVELWLVGHLDPGENWGEVGDRIKKVNLVPWRNLPGIQAGFDINLAPLQVDNPFGQSKSEVKYIEAALLRVPTVASPSDSYQFAIRDGHNGCLRSSPQEWEECIEKLHDDHALRAELGSHAYQDVITHYHPLVRARQIVEILNTIAANRYQFRYNPSAMEMSDEKKPQKFWSSAIIESTPTLFQRGIYTLKYRDFQTLLKQVWIFIRRSVSPIFPFPNSP
jgi:glycosyltransferase involved in cell wall biosynthesis